MTCAIWKPNRAGLSQESRPLVDRSLYVFPISWFRFLGAHLYFLLTHPAAYMRTLFFILTRHIHAHFTINAASIALVLSRLLGISFSFTAHNIFFTDRLLLSEKVRQARFVVAISEFSKQFLLRLVPGAGLAGKIHIVHCGLSPEEFVPSPRPRNDTPRILFVAQLSERKGAPVLVQACRVLTGRGVAFRCTIVGDGPQRPLLEQADLFVLPCITARDGDMDGIPVSLMEAMAMEIPVVSTTVSGIPELIENEQSGLLVAEKDVTALADGLQRLLADEARRVRLGKAGRQKIIREFNVHQNADPLAMLFESYLTEPETS